VNSRFLHVLPQRCYNRLLSQKQSLHWRLSERRWHLENCDNEYNSDWLKVVFERILESEQRPISVLEFGCSAANNLHTIRKILPSAVDKYCGIDINQQAIAFAQARFPQESFHAGDHKWFIQNAGGLGSFDLFIASHVLYYIDEPSVRLLLTRVRQLAKYCAIVDKMERFDAPSGNCTGAFFHPFKAISNELGFRILNICREFKIDSGGRYGYFVAETT